MQSPKLVLLVTEPGHEVIIGAWLSLTVTVKVQLATLPDGSVTVYLTVDTPLLNDPLASATPLRVVAPVMAKVTVVVPPLQPAGPNVGARPVTLAVHTPEIGRAHV